MIRKIVCLFLLIASFGCQKTSGPDDGYLENMLPHSAEVKNATQMEYETRGGTKENILYVKTGNTPLKAGEIMLETNGGYIISCEGSCDCSVQFNFPNGEIKCSCSPCRMRVVQIE